MTGAEIRAVITPLGYPCVANIYTGTDETYFVFNWQVFPGDFADDEPQHERYLVQLHLYAPHTQNTESLRKSVRQAIQGAFMRPSELPASDEVNQHYVFEFEVADGDL